MIVKPLSPDDPYNLLPEEPEPEEEIEIQEAPSDVEVHEDGSATVMLGDSIQDVVLPDGHYENMVEALGEEEVRKISNELGELIESDIRGRADWEETYVSGLEYLGVKNEERDRPWKGASGVFHPLIMEAAVRFQSQAIQEIFPPAGPAKTRITGKETPEKTKRAQRIQDELNYHLTVKMPDYRGETERLLFRLALAGGCFRKVWTDPAKNKVCARFISAEDFIVPYGESDLSSAERLTEVVRLSKNQMKKMKLSGYYADIELSDPSSGVTDPKEKEAELLGVKPVSPATDQYTVWESHVDLDLGEDPDGMPLPYIVCMEKDSKKVLSIRRNWRSEDPTRSRKTWFVAYEYVPGLGFYGFGLIHLIGGIAKSATSIMRQLIDAGTVSNLPGGLKSRGLRIAADDTPIRPGEFRDVDVAAGKIEDSITFIPHKEPSLVLHNLLKELIDEGRRVGSIAEVNVGQMQGETPVGTMLAIIERAQKVMSAVQARLHVSLGKELNLIAENIRDYMDPFYEYDELNEFNRGEDFAETGVQIIPVSDPGATSMAQRVVQHQAAMQMASQDPQLYDRAKLHRTGLEVLGIKNAEELVPLQEEMKPTDPVSENVAIISGKPVKVFLEQDHEAHIAVHMAAIQDPKIASLLAQNPAAQVIMSSAQAHVAEHLAFAYRKRMESLMGAPLPEPGSEANPEIDSRVAQAAAQAAQTLLQQNQQEAAAQAAAEAAQDPVLKLQQDELEVKKLDQQRKYETDMRKIDSEEKKTLLKSQVELARISQGAEVEGARIGAKASADHERNMVEAQKAADMLEASVNKANNVNRKPETGD